MQLDYWLLALLLIAAGSAFGLSVLRNRVALRFADACFSIVVPLGVAMTVGVCTLLTAIR